MKKKKKSETPRSLVGDLNWWYEERAIVATNIRLLEGIMWEEGYRKTPESADSEKPVWVKETNAGTLALRAATATFGGD